MKNRLFRWGDALPIVACMALIAGCGAVGFGVRSDRVQVQTPDAVYILPLTQDSSQTFAGQNGLSVTVTVADGRVAVTQAECPDQVCVHTGELGKTVRSIACVPAGIVVSYTGDDEAPDAVAR